MYRILTKPQLTGHDVFELAAGRFPPPWGAGSLYLEEADLRWLQKYLLAALPRMNWYGPNLLGAEEWKAVLQAFDRLGDAQHPAERNMMEQLDIFVCRALETDGIVTLYGV